MQRFPPTIARVFEWLKPRRRYDCIVVSFGGTATTTMLDYLGTCLSTNSSNSEHDGIKHANSPQHPIFNQVRVARCLYLYGDPILTCLSLFRRNFQRHMIPKLTAASYCSTSEYNAYVASHESPLTWEEFLSDGRDAFGINQHWLNWSRMPVKFPTLLVPFDGLHEHLEEVSGFLGLSGPQQRAFPPRKDRQASIIDLDSKTEAILRRIYHDTIDDMASFPPILLRQ